jgi:alpha-tubulin suppressor-like RCC1 family protein
MSRLPSVSLFLASNLLLLCVNGCSDSPEIEDAAEPALSGDGAAAPPSEAGPPDGASPDAGVDAGTSGDGDAGLAADTGGDAQASGDAASEDPKDAASFADAAGDASADAASAMPDAALDDASFMDASDAPDASEPLDANEPADAGDAPEGGPAAALPRQLSLGRRHGCSLDSSISGLLCWGDNRAGQTRVPSLSSPTAVAAGGDATCVIDARRVRCFGDGSSGVTDVPTLRGNPSLIAVGDAHACAFSASGGVRCWGNADDGRLSPPSLTTVRALGAGAKHSCALTDTGVTCWGDNSQGQLNVPSLVAPTALAVGAFHNCVIDSGQVKCWGGTLPALSSDVPRVVQPRAIAAGASHTCVIDRQGVKCWGDPAADDLTPPELTWPYQIAVGGGGQEGFACVHHLQGVACWGGNTLGQTNYDGGPLHVLHHSEATINAPPELIWDIILDLDSYPEWNPYTIAMQSTLKVGDAMVMTVKMSDLVTLTQTEYIRVIEPGHKICWGIDTDTPELNSGERCQWLEPKADGTTRYVTEDLIEGTLNPIVNALFDQDVQTGFDAVAASLKTRAEALKTP